MLLWCEKKLFKMIIKKNLYLIILVLFFTLPSISFAHKVRVFAYVNGDRIEGEAAFSGNRWARNSKIIVKAQNDSKIIHTCLTNENGKFDFLIPEQAKKNNLDLLIIVNAGEGHQGEWLLQANEYLSSDKEHLVTHSHVNETSDDILKPDDKRFETVDRKLLKEVIGEVIDEKLAPVKHMIAKTQNQEPGLRDILGGIGYIIGLAGIIAYFKSEDKRKDS
jgi:nickel transport protein